MEGGKTDENNYTTSLLDDFFNTNQDNNMYKESGILEPIKAEGKIG